MIGKSVPNSKVRAELRLLSPQDATALLENQVDNQRSQKPHRVAQYAKEMALSADGWKGEASVIGITSEGRLVNGQHRLQAQVDTGKSVCHVVVEGIRPEATPYIDQGTERSLADACVMNGIITDKQEANALTAIAHLVMRGDQSGPVYGGASAPNLSYKMTFVRDNLALLRAARADVRSFGDAQRHLGLGTAPLSYCCYRAREAGHAESFHNFMLQVFNGEDDAGTPAWALRRAYLSYMRRPQRPGVRSWAAVTLKGFIKQLRGEAARQAIHWSNREPFPDLLGWAAAPPEEDFEL